MSRASRPRPAASGICSSSRNLSLTRLTFGAPRLAPSTEIPVLELHPLIGVEAEPLSASAVESPPADSSALSISSWRISRHRPAPTARRMVISLRRAAARPGKRPARLAQAISRARPSTAAIYNNIMPHPRGMSTGRPERPIHRGRHVISTRTGSSFFTGTANSEGGSILKSDNVAGMVPDIRVSLPCVVF